MARLVLSALRLRVAIDKLDHRRRRVVAVAEAGLEHAQVAAVAARVTRPELLEELLDGILVADLRDRETARVEIAPLAESHELLDDRTEILRLRQRGDDLLMADQS